MFLSLPNWGEEKAGVSKNATRPSYQDSVFVFLKLFIAANFQLIFRFLIKLILTSYHFFGGIGFSSSLLYHFLTRMKFKKL